VYEDKEGWWAASKRIVLALGMLFRRGGSTFFFLNLKTNPERESHGAGH